MTHPSVRDAPRITSFKLVRPAHVAAQRETFEWLARAHTESARRRAGGGLFDARDYHACVKKLLDRVGCAPGRIAMRGHEVPDCAHTSWDDMRIYGARRGPDGAGTRERSALFARAAEAAIDRLYAGEEDPPRDLVHVTCTGYVSPSAAQVLVGKRGWGQATRVTHAYDMGCYAAIPALRIAGAPEDGRTDVVHTEICSLHFQPSQHSAEQLVVQTLFADGHIRYSVSRAESPAPPGSLAVIAAREEILPDSADAMTWTVGDFGMDMTLARDVPERIARAARDFLGDLFAEASLDFAEERARAVFAVHPGGPRLIDAVQQALELADEQVAVSRDVLRRCGNMSSATLPHIWMDLARARNVLPGTRIASLAFGPGLTIAGALMIKS